MIKQTNLIQYYIFMQINDWYSQLLQFNLKSKMNHWKCMMTATYNYMLVAAPLCLITFDIANNMVFREKKYHYSPGTWKCLIHFYMLHGKIFPRHTEQCCATWWQLKIIIKNQTMRLCDTEIKNRIVTFFISSNLFSSKQH